MSHDWLRRIVDWPELPAHWMILMLFGVGFVAGFYAGWPIGRRIGRRERDGEES